MSNSVLSERFCHFLKERLEEFPLLVLNWKDLESGIHILVVKNLAVYKQELGLIRPLKEQ